MKKKAWLFAAATLLGFVIVAVLLDLLLPVAGRDRGMLWVGLIALGIGAAVLVHRHFAPRIPRKRGPTDVDLLLQSAGKRLAASRIAGGKIRNLPVVLLLGPHGSAKTTTIAESGFEPELLAGETSRGDMVAPTGAVNVWYAKDGLLVEAGGGLPDDPARWQRLLRRLRPGRLAAALGRGRQAPRVAIVCYSCEELVAAGASSTVPAAARKLRDQLTEVSQRLGVRLPVYVVFTKADRLPYFEEYVRGLSRAEAQELLGATLPIAEVAPGAYADFQAGRLRDAFEGIFRSLARWRLELLPREGSDAGRTRAYEFPREVRKISGLASAFLVELCRPSQLGINPFLRGFYFTGVRPIVVSDAPAAAPAAAPQRQVSLGATGVFGIADITGAPQAAAPRAGTRRVPDWVFLRRILPEVVLPDERAQALTAGGARVDLLRRGLIAAAAIVLLVLSTGFTVSYANNRELLADGRRALESVRPLRAAVGEAPPAGSLLLLDSLRTVVDRLSDHERDGRPLRLRWGLYSGDAARPALREVYFDRFAGLLWNDGRQDLLARLQDLPSEPQATTDYARTYGALKAYLVTTSHPQESSPEFLTPALLSSWRYAPGLDPQREQLVRRQFDFFASELPLGNPYPAEPSESVVIAARTFLQKFTGLEPFYRALLAEASEAGDGLRFSQAYPGSESVVQNPFVVPAAFTEAGWGRVEATLADMDRLLAREDWVLGERASITPGERARLASDLRTRYIDDYVGAWREYLTAGSVSAFTGPDDAARKLTVLSSNQSPLLQMLSLAARHTAVDSTVMRRVFQPVHAVVPPGETERFVNDGNSPYVNALLGLQSAMAQVASATGPARTDALAQAAASAEQVSGQVRQLAQGFDIEGDARVVGSQVQRLLEAPVTSARGLVRGLPSASVNAAGARFCAPFRALEAKFPFNPRATQQATMEEVAAALQPGASALWAFYDEALQDLLVPQGNRYAARIGADPQPTASFVAFFNRAAGVSSALFPEGATTPTVRFALTIQTSDALPEVLVTIDGQTQTFARTMPAAKTFTWDGARARTVRIARRANGNETTLLESNVGAWSLVHLLQMAQWERSGPDRYNLRWPISTEPGVLTGTITFAGGSAVFAPDNLRLGCVSQVVR